jgi:uncharacterized protein YgbK (DUF1537 family)
LNQRWLILADDLTGAADAAVAFARRGHDTGVSLSAAPPGADLAVQALDLATRALPAPEAGASHGDAVRRRLGPGLALFKKIDSTLRGQPAAEIAAISAMLRELGRPSWGMFAPANPAMRRTTRDGLVLVDGRPLEESITWKREHSYPDADLGAVIGSAGLRAVKLPLAALRGDGSGIRAAFQAAAASDHAAGTILVCDSETDADLARLAEAARENAPGFFIGTAGLANALAGVAPGKPQARIKLEPSSRGTLVAVGTLALVSRQAARLLAAREKKSLFQVGPGEVSLIATMTQSLARGETAVALLVGSDWSAGTVDSRYAEDFSAALGPALRQMGALIVTGGETAAALLARCKVHGIRLLDEIEPGIALGMTQGAIEVPIITKPGAFGDEESLARCLDTLNELRRNA